MNQARRFDDQFVQKLQDIIEKKKQRALVLVATHDLARLESVFSQATTMSNGALSNFTGIEEAKQNYLRGNR